MCKVQTQYVVLPAEECQRLCECIHLVLYLLCKFLHFLKDAISVFHYGKIFLAILFRQLFSFCPAHC